MWWWRTKKTSLSKGFASWIFFPTNHSAGFRAKEHSTDHGGAVGDVSLAQWRKKKEEVTFFFARLDEEFGTNLRFSKAGMMPARGGVSRGDLASAVGGRVWTG